MTRTGSATAFVVAVLCCSPFPLPVTSLRSSFALDMDASFFDSTASFGHRNSKNWTFLERFAWGAEASWQWDTQIDGKAVVGTNDDSQLGPLHGIGNLTGLPKGFHLLAFYDDQWDSVYPHNDFTCKELVDLSPNQWSIPERGFTQSNGKLQKKQSCSRLGPDGRDFIVPPANPPKPGEMENVVYDCNGEMTFGSLALNKGGTTQLLNDKYWYLVLACCDCQPVKLTMSMHLTNGQSNWIREFSTDESWIFTLSVFGLAFNLAILLAQMFSDKDFEGGSHMTRFLFKVSVSLNIVAFICYVAYRDKYSSEGSADKSNEYAGDVFWLLGEVTFQALLFLLAKGWTVYRPELRKSSLIKMCIFLFVYFIVYINVLVYERNNFDEAKVRFRYDSGPGTIMCIMYFVSWGWFSWYIYVTLKMCKQPPDLRIDVGHHGNCPEEKFLFFKVFWAVFTVWFLMFPIAVFALISDAADFDRANVAGCVFVVRQCLGQLVMLCLWWPSHHNALFPFERSATTIGFAPNKNPNHAGYQDEAYQDVDGGTGAEYQVNLEAAQDRRNIFQASPTNLESSMRIGNERGTQEADPDDYVNHSRLNRNKLPPIQAPATRGESPDGEENTRV